MSTIPIIHPGEILLEEFIKPMSLSQNKLAIEIKVPARRINEICLGKRGISADTALRLSLFFGTTADFWLNLQKEYELRNVLAEDQGRLATQIQPFEEYGTADEKLEEFYACEEDADYKK